MQVESTVLVDVRYDEDDQLYIAEVRDLQGCWASGKNHDELFDNLKVAIVAYYEAFESMEVVKVESVGEPVADLEHGGQTHSELKVLAGAC